MATVFLLVLLMTALYFFFSRFLLVLGGMVLGWLFFGPWVGVFIGILVYAWVHNIEPAT